MKNSIPLGFIRIFILLICLTSCGSKKQQKVALPADFKGPKELARLYGVRITPEDNIFLYNEGAVMMLQSCDVADNRRDMLCGNWESVEGKPDVLIYKEGEAYKVTVFRRSGLRRKLKPETYLLQEKTGNLFMNTGFRIDVSYNEATDVLTFSPGGDYVRVKPQPGHPTEE